MYSENALNFDFFWRRSSSREIFSGQRLAHSSLLNIRVLHSSYQIWTDDYEKLWAVQAQICHDCVQHASGCCEYVLRHWSEHNFVVVWLEALTLKLKLAGTHFCAPILGIQMSTCWLFLKRTRAAEAFLRKFVFCIQDNWSAGHGRRIEFQSPNEPSTFSLIPQVFIVLKKNNRQLTFLHCYHHAGMIVFGYIGAKWVPGGPPIMLCLCNTWVHAVMYLYYLLNTFYPKLKNSSWKKYITQIQLLQFAYLTIHFFNCLMSDCGFPRMLLVLCVAQGFGFFFMFAQFYHGAYLKTKTQWCRPWN